jgi:hypothetical protein
MKNPDGSYAGLGYLGASPADIFKRRSVEWRGLQVETFEATQLKPFEFMYSGNRHLLVAVEAGSREDGESCIDGLLISTPREYSGKLTLIPSGHKFAGRRVPRVLFRSIFLYIDPKSPILSPDLRFEEARLEPRPYFSNSDLWETARKLKHALESQPKPRMRKRLKSCWPMNSCCSAAADRSVLMLLPRAASPPGKRNR